jgi:hypothetical protein
MTLLQSRHNSTSPRSLVTECVLRSCFSVSGASLIVASSEILGGLPVTNELCCDIVNNQSHMTLWKIFD